MKHLPLSNRDLMSRITTSGSRRTSSQPAYWLLFSLVTIFAALILTGIQSEPARATRNVPLQLTQQEQTHSPEGPLQTTTPETVNPEKLTITTINEASAPAAGGIDDEWQTVTVKSGDSLALIFSRLDISPQQLHQILSLGGAATNLKKIYPGQTLRFVTNPKVGLEKLDYRIDDLNSMEVHRKGDGFEIVISHRIPERRITNASAVITSSLFLAAQKANLSDNLTMELASLFGWDVDFALDIRKNDRFTVLYEELYLDGEKIDDGNILAAEFVNRGKIYQAIRYTDQSGRIDYYSPDGKSMRKAFLRTPVEFTRISSRFSVGRKHPILNRIRAHKGVDYAAARGTPVMSTSNGKIIYRGKKGGYGNTIIVQHGTKYSTLYAHLSKYRSRLKKGSRVKQGQIIGYVGSSGLATGPHLHYELRVDGVHRDPLRVKLPGADPLDKKYMADFREKSTALIAQLDTIRSVQVASSE